MPMHSETLYGKGHAFGKLAPPLQDLRTDRVRSRPRWQVGGILSHHTQLAESPDCILIPDLDTVNQQKQKD